MMATRQQWTGACVFVVVFGASAAARAPQAQPPAPPAAAPVRACGTQVFCDEQLTFAAAITDFQAILQNPNSKTLTVRLRVKNKLNRMLALGYVMGSGTATDERGNRYSVADQTVQGIGLIRGTAADPKFLLQPGEVADARFEFVWPTSGQELFGISFQIDLALREIDPLPGGQVRLGREHALHYTGLSNRTGTAAAPPPSATAPVSGPTPPSGPLPDACAGRPQCVNGGGLFSADVIAVTPSFAMSGNLQMIEVRVRYRNASAQPLMLGYVGNSAVATDTYGGRYTSSQPAYGDGIKGIGVVERGVADSQFVLAPGATGDAVFTLSRHRDNDRRDAIGTEFNFDVTIALLRRLPSQQIETVRDYALGFSKLTPASVGALPPSPDPCGTKPKCFGAPTFTMEVTGMTASVPTAQNLHLLSTKVRFTNVGTQPLILGYVGRSTVIIDNFGGRYTLGQPAYGDGVKGIGVVQRGEADTGFLLRPGATGDATFTVSRVRNNDRSDPIGKTFTFEVTVAELEVLPSQQVHTVRDYAIGIPNLSASGPSLLQQLIKPPKGGSRRP